jgi:hypothetical protein
MLLTSGNDSDETSIKDTLHTFSLKSLFHQFIDPGKHFTLSRIKPARYFDRHSPQFPVPDATNQA